MDTVQSTQAIITFLKRIFQNVYCRIRNEIKDWHLGKDVSFYFIDPQNETLVTETPLIRRLLVFFLDYFDCVDNEILFDV